MPKRLILLAAVLSLGLALAATASGKRQVVRTGTLYLADDGGISPTRLPRHEAAPVTARLLGEIGTDDGSHPPALKQLAFDVDRTIGIDTKGLPTCRRRQLLARTSAAAKHACAGALLGTGSAEVEVTFEEQAPFSATGPLYLFNGGTRGRTTTVFLHTYLAVPVPTAVVVRATVTRIHRGPYGLRIEAKIPKIAGGAASVTRFELKIGRRFRQRGRRRSFLRASCPTGHWLTKGAVEFADGTRLAVQHAFSCVPS